MNPYYGRVAGRANHRCEYCQAPEAIFNFPFEVEHIVPPAQGGTEADDNRALPYRSCNVHKSDRRHAPDPQSAEAVPLSDPRADKRSNHYRVDTTPGDIRAQTEVG